MSTDRELLEMASKAAGIYLEWDGHPDQWQPMYYEGKTYHSWEPLTDDGDALRLAVKLGLGVDVITGSGTTVFFKGDHRVSEAHGADIYASTRRAIVRAAAEIGIRTP